MEQNSLSVIMINIFNVNLLDSFKVIEITSYIKIFNTNFNVISRVQLQTIGFHYMLSKLVGS
jgi:hypothetical protein